MVKRSSLCGMVHGSDQGGATDKNSHEATEARHDGIESDLVGTAAVGGPETPRGPLGQAGLRLGRQALDAVLLRSGTHGAESVMRIELEEIAGPDHYSSDPALQQWAP